MKDLDRAFPPTPECVEDAIYEGVRRARRRALLRRRLQRLAAAAAVVAVLVGAFSFLHERVRPDAVFGPGGQRVFSGPVARSASPDPTEDVYKRQGLGVGRETLGDIALLREGALLFVHADIAAYVAANLESCGRVKVRVSPCGEEVAPPEPEGTLIYRTVPSERLDAVLSAAYDLSRQKAQEMIRAELVKVDHAVETRLDARLQEGSLVSARGLGRFRLREVTGLTRKGRVGLRLFVYGK